jgi:hypothetical protein
MLRHNVGPTGDPDEMMLNLWTVVVDVGGVVAVDFDNCSSFAITPDDLVGDDHGPTRALADRLRDGGASGLRVPSAALPGTDNLVVFGARVIHPFLQEPPSDVECPTGHLTDGARPAAEVAALVRWIGDPHAALDAWKATGKCMTLVDPMSTRW